MINSRNIDDLDPEAREVCLRHIAACHARGIEIIVTSTYRDYESQESLYAIGRTIDKGTRRPVTNARAGHSWHNFKCAWDVVPIVHGKPVWNDKDPIWQEVVICGESAGAEAGAKWTSFPDLPHFQLRPTIEGLHINLDDARARFDANGTIFTA